MVVQWSSRPKESNPADIRDSYSPKGVGETSHWHVMEVASVAPTDNAPFGEKELVLGEARDTAGILREVHLVLNYDGIAPLEGMTGRIRMYVDNWETPMVDAPVSEFFLLGERADEGGNERFGRTNRGNYTDTFRSSQYRYLNVPFKHYFRVAYVFDNDGVDDKVTVWSTCAFSKVDAANFGDYPTYQEIAGRDADAPLYDDIELCNISGAGVLDHIQFGALQPGETHDYEWQEGDLEVWVDGRLLPTSGNEDWVGGGFFASRRYGWPAGSTIETDGALLAYHRFFPNDPIYFSESLRIVGHLGQRGQSGPSLDSEELTDDAGTWTAFWNIGAYTNAERAARWLTIAETLYDADMNGANGTLPAGMIDAGGDKWHLNGTGALEITDAGASNTVARVACPALPQGARGYFADMEVEFTESDNDAEVFLQYTDVALGEAAAVEVIHTRAQKALIASRDGFNGPGDNIVYGGKEIGGNGARTHLGLMVIDDDQCFSFYRYENDSDHEWRPLLRWTTEHPSSHFAVGNWIARAKVHNFRIRAVREVTA